MSLQKFANALTIFAKYCPNGMQQTGMLGADHDEIYVYVSQDDLAPESEDGENLQELGWQPHDGGNWSKSV